MNSSIKKDTINCKLTENIETDILVIGAGIAGIVCANELKQLGYEVVVVDKYKPGSSVTAKTTAFLSIEQDYLYCDMIKELGLDKAKEFLNHNVNAFSFYEELSEKHDIGFNRVDLILYSTEDENKILREKNALEKLGIDVCLVDSIDLNLNIKKGLKISNQGYVDPYKVINVLSKNLKIYAYTNIEKLTTNVAYTKEHTIKFKKVIVATNYPFLKVKGFHFLKLTQKISSVALLQNAKVANMYISVDDDGLYIRPYEDKVVIGGFDRNVENIDQNNSKLLKDQIESIFTESKIINEWVNQDVVTLDHVPYIGKFDLLHSNWYIISGFNLWGFLWAVAAGRIIATQISTNQKSELTNPQRFYLNKAFVKHTLNTFKSLLKIKKPRCTHFGSSLNYNKFTQCWECPSHGSKFTKDGKVVQGPAQKDLYF